VSLIVYQTASWGGNLAHLPISVDQADEPEALHQDGRVFPDRRVHIFTVNLDSESCSEFGTIWATELALGATLIVGMEAPISLKSAKGLARDGWQARLDVESD
jgi:hypothetical protein